MQIASQLDVNGAIKAILRGAASSPAHDHFLNAYETGLRVSGHFAIEQIEHGVSCHRLFDAWPPSDHSLDVAWGNMFRTTPSPSF